jgi:hypothetical protein
MTGIELQDREYDVKSGRSYDRLYQRIGDALDRLLRALGLALSSEIKNSHCCPEPP